jgi:mannosyltransferase
MAVARPIRLLGAFTILLVLILVFQFSRTSTPFIGKGGRLTDGMKKDPLLDRMILVFSHFVTKRQ